MPERIPIRECCLAAVLALFGFANERALAQAPAPPAVAPATQGAAETLPKDAMLRNVVRDVIAPGYRELAAKCQALTESVGKLRTAPSAETLEKARQAWIAALLASRRIQWLQSGPIADREYLATFYYWKVLSPRIESVLKSDRVIDDAYLAEQGATARGMFTLEHLLFKGDPAPGSKTILDLFSGPESTRRGQYALALARDVEAKARQLAEDWSAAGDQTVAAKFISNGQKSLNQLVNHLAQFIEQVAEQRINFVLKLPQPVASQLDRIEGSPSGTSLRSLEAMLEGSQKLYRGTDGTGLADYLKNLNPSLAERIKGHFETALAEVQVIGAPLEQVVTNQRASVEKAYEKTRALEVLCKTDLASALGVTLTFTSGDGD